MKYKSIKGKVFETEEQPFKLGGSALIWKCIAPNENYCIKEFRLGNQKKISEEFSNELERLSKIEHPNILKVIDWGEMTFKTSPFIVFELCDGNLRDILQKHDFLPKNKGLKILSQITSALDYLHKTGTIHGDIKPENILFKGNNLFLLSDFGYSKHIGFQENMTIKISPREMAGTTLYLSPEQLKDNKQTQLSDIYSLAFVAYEIFTGKTPINTEVSIYQQIQQKIEDRIIDPINYNPQINPNIKKAILKNLIADPHKRSKSALYFMNELEGNFISEESEEKKQLSGNNQLKDNKKNWWNKLSTNNKVIIIVAIIGAIATIIGALLG